MLLSWILFRRKLCHLGSIGSAGKETSACFRTRRFIDKVIVNSRSVHLDVAINGTDECVSLILENTVGTLQQVHISFIIHKQLHKLNHLLYEKIVFSYRFLVTPCWKQIEVCSRVRGFIARTTAEVGSPHEGIVPTEVDEFVSFLPNNTGFTLESKVICIKD